MKGTHMGRRSIAVAAVVILVVVFATSAFAADDPFVGTRKLNVAKSKLPSSLSPKSQTNVDELRNDGSYRSVQDGIDANGKTFHSELIWKSDGKAYPITGDPIADTIAFKRINARTHEYVISRDGKQVMSGKTVVSKNGKTFTQTHRQKDQKGQDARSTFVFEKQ
jgi:hypothetical protein